MAKDATVLTTEEAVLERLERRDERVRAKLVAKLAEWREDAEAARQTAAELEKMARDVEADVLAGRWFALVHILGTADVDSLSECHASELCWYIREE